MHVTLHEVAKRAGVSVKTVSRVVNNQGEISEATRKHVQAAIDELGYRPNILARSLVNQRSNTLGVVAWGIDYYGPSRALLGVEQKSDELGYSLFLNLMAHPGDNNSKRILDTLVARRVDGIIWAVPEVGDNRAWLNTAQVDNLPPIVFLTTQPRVGLNTLSIDNHWGGIQATQHLIQEGRRHIGFIAGPLTWWEARERYAGWQEALRQANLTPSPTLMVEADWSAETGAAAMQALLDRDSQLDAVFACSDQIALGALGVAHRLGRRIPQDIAIVGFDNTPESAHFWPPLTTIYQHLVDIGSLAVEHLHRIIEAKRNSEIDTEPIAISQVPELIIRESSRHSSR
jgi:DNA-binding LacI/PurR family transcriptional regulator